MVHDPNSRDWVKAFYDSAADWWGESWYEGENLQYRLARVEKYIGKPPKDLLELAAGTGETAGFLAAAGYAVTALDISDKNYQMISKLASQTPLITAVQGDFLTTHLDHQFDAVCLFEGFGMGTDNDQRLLLKRIRTKWLKPGGVLLMDVYHPFGPIRLAGSVQELDRLEDVPGSVDIIERSYYDGILGRWVDEWQPVEKPENLRRQSIRCYTPADLCLLLEGTGLEIAHAEFAGGVFDPRPQDVSLETAVNDYEKDYAYCVVLKAA